MKKIVREVLEIIALTILVVAVASIAKDTNQIALVV
jgi:hypothetical protein